MAVLEVVVGGGWYDRPADDRCCFTIDQSGKLRRTRKPVIGEGPLKIEMKMIQGRRGIVSFQGIERWATVKNLAAIRRTDYNEFGKLASRAAASVRVFRE